MPSHAPAPCPLLPEISSPVPVTHTRVHREECGPHFYFSCLELAQSQWLHEKPAQAILQLDKAMMAVLPDNHSILDSHPIPYDAILWMIKHARDEHFLGDPVRHFQHLATRMNPKQAQPELRIARAWACLHLTEQEFPERGFSRDLLQIQREQIEIPTARETLKSISAFSPHLSEITYLQNHLHS
ncbi:hypothetical protein [Rubritalea marina]|uniref:hypothetical protein n=1 Tax=Rubritalea marina TaxID=361055 RepID=UPI0003685961|nr:hypothetical protein [Rubritalea marina]